MPNPNPQTILEWARWNLDKSHACLATYAESPDPRTKMAALLDAYRYSYGALINFKDVGDEYHARLARDMVEGLGERVLSLMVDGLVVQFPEYTFS